HAPHQGAAVRVAVQPDGRGVPAGPGRRDRPVGGRPRPVGDYRRALQPSAVRNGQAYPAAGLGAGRGRCVRRVQQGDQRRGDGRVAKAYGVSGWGVGWMIGPSDVIKAAANLQSHATSNVCNVAQAAALAAVTGDLSAVEAMRVAFDRRRTTMTTMLNEIPGVI